ncbi:undecaprenyl-phosphate glucose phosphotransferase [Lutibacter sp. HS1-25]|uniref:undecaprenyl-phosphate glucose phosphotransferase n=1 Tax=Lutibacter sp. HS1-25 TaxID=2485000 RepID=UPI0010124B1F|nr:undecaprenyl-phosphate glucose phosphotransferase [Lutibacter sp. HS1-25]RXP44556.1 undecaprenyl-phosphate glucose phosphotransferase [Lutibacter sp. HS1-25]
MPQSKSKIYTAVSFSGDLILLSISFFIASIVKFGTFTPHDNFYYTLFFGWEILWILLVLKFNLYEIPKILYIDKILSKNLKALIYFVFLSAALIFFITDYKFSRVFFVTTVFIFSFNVIVWRSLLLFYAKRRRYKDRSDFTELVLIGVNNHITRFVRGVYTDPKYGYRIVGIFTDATILGRLKKFKRGSLKESIAFLEQNKSVKEIVISLPHSQSVFINELLEYADNNLIRVTVIPEFSEYLSQLFSIEYVENIPLMKFRREPLQSLSNRILKRGMDVVFSIFIIVFVFTWLFPLLAILIKLTSKGPVFFAQERSGKDDRPFKCYKFRSMTVNSESDKLQATKNDARVTKIGAILRRTSMDELPQIFNVLFNDMSLVGPRPHMLKHTEQYRVLVDKYMVRHFAKPGVTGWAQILGFRGETKTVKDMEKRAHADIWYIENWNLMLDIKIMFRTVFIVFFKKEDNAY